jgi:multimeric flavodoxin WrbA
MSRILAISGSLRPGGNTDTFLEQFVAGARKAGAKVEIFYLRNYNINPCIGCEQCRGKRVCVHFNDGMSLFYPKIEESRGIILGSPVYNYNITPPMKAFIDRLFPYYVFTNDVPRGFSSLLDGQGRKAIVFAVGEQKVASDMSLALPAMALPLQALGYDVCRRMLFRGFYRKDEAGENKNSLRRAFCAGAALGEMVKSGLT